MMSKMLLLRQILALVVLGPLHGEMAHAASSSSAPGPSTDAANAIVPGPVFQEIDSALANPSLAAALVSQYDDKDLISKLRGAIADPSLQDVIQSRTGDPEFMSSMYNKAAKLGLMSGSAAVVSATNQTSIDYISVHSSGGGGGGGANGNIGSLRPSGLSSTPTLVSDVILNRTRPIHLSPWDDDYTADGGALSIKQSSVPAFGFALLISLASTVVVAIDMATAPASLFWNV